MSRCSARRERGAASLVIAVIVMLITAIAALYTAKHTMGQMVLASATTRMEEASAAASAGLDYGVAQFEQSGLPNPVPTLVNVPGEALAGGTAFYRFCTETSTPNNCTTASASDRNIKLIATGFAADGQTSKSEEILLSIDSLFDTYPNIPLLLRGASSFTLSGNVTVINNVDNTTIWTAANAASFNGSFETRIQVDGQNNQVSSRKSGSTFFVGPDMIFNDANLANLSRDALMQQLTGKTLSQIAAMADLKLEPGQSLPSDPDGQNWGGKIIYVNQPNFEIRDTLGSTTNPVVLIVNGNVEIAGSRTLNGLLIANDLTRAAGSSRINGSVLLNNLTGANGGFTIEASQSVIEGLRSFGSRAALRYSWRDW